MLDHLAPILNPQANIKRIKNHSSIESYVSSIQQDLVGKSDDGIGRPNETNANQTGTSEKKHLKG